MTKVSKIGKLFFVLVGETKGTLERSNSVGAKSLSVHKGDFIQNI